MPTVGEPEPKAATDDWPFLYLRTPFIAPHYLAGLAFALLIAIVGRRRRRARRRHVRSAGSARTSSCWASRSCCSRRARWSASALLFGSTWLVNALAFFAILASVLLAIFVNARLRIRRPGVLYGVLFVALAVAFALPPESLLIDPPWLRYLLAGVVAFAPVFLANLVFTYSFRDTRTADMAFASNLLGAMAGGALEYVALLTGYRAPARRRGRALPAGLALRHPLAPPRRRGPRHARRRRCSRLGAARPRGRRGDVAVRRDV